MSHGITEKDSLFVVRKPAWHGLGTVLKRPPRDIGDALRKSGLSWKVKLEPIYRKERGSYVEVPDFFQVVRQDTRDTLGAVGPRYVPIQNEQAMQFLDQLLGTSMLFESAGSLHTGRDVWVLTRLPEWIDVGGDKIGQFVLIRLRHDGQGSVQVTLTPVRVVCANTLSWALDAAAVTYKIRHVGSPDQHVHEAREVLNLSVNYGKQFKKFGDRLAGQKMTERKMGKVLEQLYPGETGMGDRQVKNRQRAREAVMHLFIDGPTVGNAPGSKWCAVNAIHEHVDFGAKVRSDEGRFERTLGDPEGIKARGRELVVAA